MILQFAGQTVNNFDSLVEILRHYNPGDNVDATVYRDGEVRTVPPDADRLGLTQARFDWPG